ncbi:hypothetical protein [Micromonospora rosaria]|uniref:hypothetical protein n=1 Tax=Micromonospora rosaria TaxID=47874 RepID=UPI000B18C408|nr:hypothetical protein [Micromonospora rosaria]
MGRTTALKIFAVAAAIAGFITFGAAAAQADDAAPTGGPVVVTPSPSPSATPSANHPWD